MPYQILNWDDHFENFKSRTVKRCGFACVPNKQHGEGFTYIMSLEDGLSIYGVFNLIVGACSQHAAPRDGWLTNNGREDGKPWTAESLAVRWRRSTIEISSALQVLCCQHVGWIGDEQYPHGIPVVSPQYDVKGIELNGIEGKGREGKRVQAAPASSEPEVPASEPASEPSFAEFPVVGRGLKTWLLPVAYVDELAGDFPNLDVPQQCRSARAWALANPSKRKTAKGMKRFLVNWMNEAVRRGQVAGGNGAGTPRADDLDPNDAAMIEEIYGAEKK